MKMRKVLSLLLVALLMVPLLCSCGDTIVMLTEPKRTNTVAMSFYVMAISDDAAGDHTGISSSDLEASQGLVEEYISIMKSTAVITRVMLAIDSQEMVITMSDFRSMLSVEPVNETAMVRVEFSSKDYTEEQLLKIAQAFASVAPEICGEVMLGIGHVALLDAPHIVE